MVDYYSILLRTVTAPGAGDAGWRRTVYERAREALSKRLRQLDPPPPRKEIAAEEAALNAAIARVEGELAWTEGQSTPPDAGADELPDDNRDDAWSAGALAAAKPARRRGLAWIATAVVVAALGAGALVYWSSTAPAPKSSKTAAAPVKAAPARARGAVADNDLPAGTDGGNSDPDMGYVYRRQPTFYRTLQPVGTIIVDKAQHFLYLIQPNNVALRYGIGLGRQCAELAGLRHIATMTQWPSWQPPPELLDHNPALMPGGPGNPLGARLLALDDGTSRIHGTNAPKTIGTSLAFGCIRLANDDVIDLFNRVKLLTPVVVN